MPVLHTGEVGSPRSLGKRLKGGVRQRDEGLHPCGRFVNSGSLTGVWSGLSGEVGGVEVRYID